MVVSGLLTWRVYELWREESGKCSEDLIGLIFTWLAGDGGMQGFTRRSSYFLCRSGHNVFIFISQRHRRSLCAPKSGSHLKRFNDFLRRKRVFDRFSDAGCRDQQNRTALFLKTTGTVCYKPQESHVLSVFCSDESVWPRCPVEICSLR